MSPSTRIRTAAARRPTLDALWGAVTLFRVFALVYAVYEFAERLADVQRPWLGWVILAVLAAWTGVMLLARPPRLGHLVVESVISVGAILATVWVDSPEVRLTGVSTVPGIWAGSIVLAWGLYAGPVAAMVAALVISAVDVVEIGGATDGTIHNIVLLFVMGACAGYCADAARRGDEALREGVRLQMQIRERERLARTVHDGVLQTLSFIHRRGRDVGGEAGHLGALAAEQERVLRQLITDGVGEPAAETGVEDRVDLTHLLRRRSHERVHVVAPVEAVMVPTGRADELAAAVGAALDNVAAHAGDAAQAWVLVEQEGDDVVVTVRDDGVGLEEEALLTAMRAGRVGVARSIMGRMHDLGGVATYASGSGAGTRLELRMPIQDRRLG